MTINGAVHVEADWFPPSNATQNFWRGAENLSVTPTGGTDRWAVSQAAPYRRMHVRGNLALDDGGWSSGGFIADIEDRRPGRLRLASSSGSRATPQFGSWTGSNWNMVFVGTPGRPGATASPTRPTPPSRRRPWSGRSRSCTSTAPAPTRCSCPRCAPTPPAPPGPSGTAAGHVAAASASSTSSSPARPPPRSTRRSPQGKNLLVTPGVYHLNQTLRVTRPDTVVLGLGLATLVPDNGVTAMTVADVDGVKVAGILFDAGTTNSPTLMEVGPAGSVRRPRRQPDLAARRVLPHRRRGASARPPPAWSSTATTSSATTCGSGAPTTARGVGWNSNTADTGLVVNGDDVTMYGLFVEHYQKYQTIWNGNGGRTYFYQNEMPYDPPNQAAWMNGSTQGYAAYKVADSVTSHEAWGLGSYCFFNVNPARGRPSAPSRCPNNPDVRFHNMVTVSLGGTGTIRHVINNRGGPSNSSTNVANLVSYP